ncbi:MAG: hypothetical protein M1298_02255 [Chloroflexi bacterium]|nr:hypothetical protein [Chloroflexota bacterium]
MFRRGTMDRWYWSADLHVGVNFCVWALLVDGLCVSPFDRHPSGDGTLRAAGLEPASWRTWLEARIARDVQAKAEAPRRAGDAWKGAYEAFAGWTGTPAVGELLASLWRRYEPVAHVWRHNARGMLPPPMKAAEEKKLWQALEPFHSRLPTLRVYFVDYPEVVSSLVPPVSLVLGSPAAALDSATYATAVRRGAEELAALANRA